MAAVAVLVGLADASAATRACRQLEAQLVDGGGSNGRTKKYDSAIAKQREQLSIARSNARRSGCSFTLFGGKAQCNAMNAQIDRMENNLASLERQRSKLGGGGISRRERARLIAAIEAQGCRDPEAREATRKKTDELRGKGSLLEQIFSNNDGIRRTAPEEQVVRTARTLSNDGTGHYAPSGNFQTMCVRTCDGYYFPMSGSSSSRDFQRDQQNCESMCPGTEMHLYFRAPTDEDPAQMMSVASSEPYASLSTAYLYKQLDTPQPAGCACGMARPGESLNSEAAASPVEPVLPLPASRPDPASDPETLANMEGGLDAATVARILKSKTEASETASTAPENRRIRVVGPMFLPDQEGAIDLRAPGQRQVQ